MVSTISHSSHPDHQLIRTRLQRSVTCSICGEGGVTSCYHCKPCKFSIHVRCAGVSRGENPRLKGAHVEMPGCKRPGQFGKPEKTSIEEVEVPGSEERRPKSSRGGANVGMPKLGHSGRIGVQGTMGAGAMGVSRQGVPTTKKGVVGAGMLRVGVLSGAAILSQVATLAVTGAGRGLVTKAITSMTGSGKSTEEGSSGIGGPGMDETEEKGEEEEGDDEEEVEDNDNDRWDDDEEEEQSLEVVKEREIGAGIEEEDEEVEEEVEEEENEEVEEEVEVEEEENEEVEEEEEVEVEEEEEENEEVEEEEEEEVEVEEEEEEDVVAIDSETEDSVPAKGFFAGMAGMAARTVTSAVVGEDVDI